jgi:hypothetical protein
LITISRIGSLGEDEMVPFEDRAMPIQVTVICLPTDKTLKGCDCCQGLVLSEIAWSHKVLVSWWFSWIIDSTPPKTGGPTAGRIFPLFQFLGVTIVVRAAKEAVEAVGEHVQIKFGDVPVGIGENTDLVLDHREHVMIRTTTNKGP